MADKPIPLHGPSQATRDRDLVIRIVRDELVAFIGRKFEAERGKKLQNLGPDVACVMEGLAEAMAVLHVDVLRSLADGGGRDAYQRKLELAKAAKAGESGK